MTRSTVSFVRMLRVVLSVGVAALSSRPLQKQTLAILLLAVAGATGVMGRNASAGIVTATLNQTATEGNPVYFSYDSGVIGTLDYASSGNKSIRGLVSVRTVPFPQTSYRLDGFVNNAGVAISPLSFGTAIGATTDWQWGFFSQVFANGYYGVKFSAGGEDWNYGWVAVSKTASSLTFGEASVETTINTPIAAGAVAPTSSVPEIDPAGMGSVLALVTGALGLLERRRLKAA
jgi:hypothetical protein